MIRPAAFLLTLIAGPALAQQPGPAAAGMPPMRHDVPAASTPGADNPPATAFRQANEAMMRNMDRPLTGDPDRDFVAGMLPHHQGAVDMARVELRFGKDPVLRRLARDIVAAQEREMKLMQDWQRRHPAP